MEWRVETGQRDREWGKKRRRKIWSTAKVRLKKALKVAEPGAGEIDAQRDS